METSDKILYANIAAIGIVFLLFIIFPPTYTYPKWKCEITYCDKRPNEIVIIESNSVPSNKTIKLGEYHPVPTVYSKENLEGQRYINVCNLKTLSQVK